jgi:hypothetical protein
MHLDIGFFLNSEEWPDDLPLRLDGVSLNSLNFLDTDGRPEGIATSSGRMLLTDKRPNGLQGRLDRCLGSDFSELEFAQNLLRTSEIDFFILVTLNLS